MSSQAPSNRSADGRSAILLRVGELFLKGRNRRVFSNALLRNARRSLADLSGVEIEASYMRLLIHCPDALVRTCCERMQRIFGLRSLSPATLAAPTLADISDAACAVAAEWPEGTTFKVETKRRDKRFPMTSQEASRDVGGQVHLRTGLPVDVRSPDHIIHVEINEDTAYVTGQRLPGPGGLPVGTGGKVGLLLSGGIDSPVAGWSIMRRGAWVCPIYFHSFPYTGDKTKEKVLDIAAALARWHGPLPVHIVHFTRVQKALREHGPARLAVVLYRRMMMRAAGLIAEREGAEALVTGENLAQVASQTLTNLATIEDAAPMPVLRPLLCDEKEEIVARARHIGTYELSIQPYEDCCSLFMPRSPATRARVGHARSAEEGLDIDAMALELADNVERIVVH